MREIKFKAWDGEQLHHYGVLVAYGKGWLEEESFDQDALRLKRDGREICLMQWTGLHDKNGKEIYEGDVLMKMGQFTKPKRALYEVVFDDGAFVGSSVVDYEVVGKGNRHLTLFPLTDEYDQFPSEVIGNIYENPELLMR